MKPKSRNEVIIKPVKISGDIGRIAIFIPGIEFKILSKLLGMEFSLWTVMRWRDFIPTMKGIYSRIYIVQYNYFKRGTITSKRLRKELIDYFSKSDSESTIEIDLYGHSKGGLIALNLALTLNEEHHNEHLKVINVIQICSPNSGANEKIHKVFEFISKAGLKKSLQKRLEGIIELIDTNDKDAIGFLNKSLISGKKDSDLAFNIYSISSDKDRVVPKDKSNLRFDNLNNIFNLEFETKSMKGSSEYKFLSTILSHNLILNAKDNGLEFVIKNIAGQKLHYSKDGVVHFDKFCSLQTVNLVDNYKNTYEICEYCLQRYLDKTKHFDEKRARFIKGDKKSKNTAILLPGSSSERDIFFKYSEFKSHLTEHYDGLLFLGKNGQAGHRLSKSEQVLKLTQNLNSHSIVDLYVLDLDLENLKKLLEHRSEIKETLHNKLRKLIIVSTDFKCIEDLKNWSNDLVLDHKVKYYLINGSGNILNDPEDKNVRYPLVTEIYYPMLKHSKNDKERNHFKDNLIEKSYQSSLNTLVDFVLDNEEGKRLHVENGKLHLREKCSKNGHCNIEKGTTEHHVHLEICPTCFTKEWKREN